MDLVEILNRYEILQYSSRGFAKAWKDASENLSGDGSQFIKAQIRLERCLDEIIDIENRFTSKSSSCLFTAKAVFSDVKKYRDNKLRDLTMLARLTKLVNMVLRMEKGLRLRDLYKLQEQLRPPSRANPFLLCCSLTPKPPKIVTAECVYAAYVEVLDHENQNDSRLRGSWNFENPPEELKGETGMCNWALGKDIHNYEELLDAWQQEVVNIARQVWDNLTRDDGERKIVTAIESLIKNIREKGPGFSKVRGITYPESLREVSV
ncbi:hypothetical protein BC936DRAFT_148469 [Jimgerdemannia flammicorona]|uniref:Uncharacterized protein n=1 Tax=Jimgerdemannia flammicorona TaxID=994334 RepID=A0A433DKK8_9FUNG|nr:hypothetical protein BC936DRAFT_148469 [Jimgerdemannia flammicorona]